MKHSCPQCIKFKKTLRSLQLGTSRELIGLLESLWHLTIREAPRGDIGKLDNETIAIELEWDNDPDELVAALVERGWLDACLVHRLVVHDWHEHAPRFIKGMVAKDGGFVFAQRPERTTRTYDPNVRPERTTATEVRDDPNVRPQQPNVTQPNISVSHFGKVRQHTQNDVAETEEAEFVHLWNATPGCRPTRNKTELTPARREVFRELLKMPGWDWRGALAKFPLAGIPLLSIRVFLDGSGDFVERVLEDEFAQTWEQMKKTAAASTAVRPSLRRVGVAIALKHINEVNDAARKHAAATYGDEVADKFHGSVAKLIASEPTADGRVYLEGPLGAWCRLTLWATRGGSKHVGVLRTLLSAKDADGYKQVVNELAARG